MPEMLAEPKKRLDENPCRPPAFYMQTSLYPLYVRQDNISNVANVRFKNFVNLTKKSIAKTRRAAQYEKNIWRARAGFQN